jgi:ABC-type multidrug transport system fused ATPase/permease subunit
MTDRPPARPDGVSRALHTRRYGLWLCICAGAIAQLSDVPLALLVGRLTDRAVRTSAAGSVVWGLPWELSALVLVLLVRFTAQWSQISRGEALAQGTLAEIRLRMFAHLHRLPLRRLARRDPGRTAVRFAGDAASLRTWIARTIVEFPADVLMLSGILIGLASIRPELAVAAAIPLAMGVPVVLWAEPRVRRLTRRARVEQAAVTGEVVRSLSDADELRYTGRVSLARRAAADRLRNARDVLVARGRTEATLHATLAASACAALVGVAALGTHLLSRAVITPGGVVSATWLAALLGAPIARIAAASVIHARARVARERIKALLDQPREPATPHPLLRLPPRLRLNRLVLPLEGCDATASINATITGPGVTQILGSRLACDALARTLLREIKPIGGRIGLNRRRLSRYPKFLLRAAIQRLNTNGFDDATARTQPLDTRPAASGTTPHATKPERVQDARASLLLVDVPDDLDGPGVASLRAEITECRPEALVLLLGGAPITGIRQFRIDSPSALHT